MLSALIVLSFSTTALVAQCGELSNASSGELISYVDNTNLNKTTPGCIATSIEKLGNQKDESAIEVLTRRLDFAWPPRTGHPQRLNVHGQEEDVKAYPAAIALEQIGKSALPNLLKYIADGANARIGRDVAISVWMKIHKSNAPYGVALLKKEADSTKDIGTRQRLNWAAFKAMSWCSTSERADCESAAAAHYPQ